VKKFANIAIVMSGDYIAFFLALMLFNHWRMRWDDMAPTGIEWVFPSLILSVVWVLIFVFFGLYRNLYMISRFDEVLRVGKIVLVGMLFLFFLLFVDQIGWDANRLTRIDNNRKNMLVYGLLTFGTVSLNRLIIRSVQKYRVLKGFGLHKAIVVGTGVRALSVVEDIHRNRTTGLQVEGYLRPNMSDGDEEVVDESRILGSINDLSALLKSKGIRDVIVALETGQNPQLIQVIEEIDIPDVSVKILPDFYQMIIGLNRTNQIFGLPLIEVMPDPMPSWEKGTKRLFDFVFSLAILAITAPIMIVAALLVRLTSKGPAIFAQERVGRFGKPYTMYKFRTMVADAEKATGPVWAQENDPRITPLGRWMRKTRIDELPQLFNVLKGEMSFVGPRPERAHFVDQFKKQIPLYSRRLNVRPGITGWAQVKWKYDASLEDVKEKTKYDLFYVENMSLRMDFKILFNTVMTVITGKGQ
jgi:exopolysaccharide biosynthesis polyprenyl glycosylphosphotransferase